MQTRFRRIYGNETADHIGQMDEIPSIWFADKSISDAKNHISTFVITNKFGIYDDNKLYSNTLWLENLPEGLGASGKRDFIKL